MMPPSRLRFLFAGDRARLTLAIALSSLLHALLLVFVPVPPVHIDYLMERVAPRTLSVDIVPPSLPAETGAPAPRRIELQPPPNPVPKARNETPEEAIRLEPDIPAPPVPVQAATEPATYAGVNVTMAYYLGPLPPRVIDFDGSAEYLREAQLDEPPIAVSTAVPEYPAGAEKEKAGGAVVVAIFIDEEGHVVRTAAVNSSEYLSRYSKEIAQAMAHSVFTPARKDGNAVKSLVFQVVHLDPAVPAPGP